MFLKVNVFFSDDGGGDAAPSAPRGNPHRISVRPASRRSQVEMLINQHGAHHLEMLNEVRRSNEIEERKIGLFQEFLDVYKSRPS